MQTSAISCSGGIQAALAQALERGNSVAFQCILAAAAESIDEAARMEAATERAAPTKVEQTRVARLRLELEAAVESLQSSASERGRALMPTSMESTRRLSLRKLLSERGAPRTRGVVSWPERATETLHALESGIARMAALAECQSPQAPSRALAEATASLLRTHRDELATLVGLTEPVARS